MWGSDGCQLCGVAVLLGLWPSGRASERICEEGAAAPRYLRLAALREGEMGKQDLSPAEGVLRAGRTGGERADSLMGR